MLLFRRQLSRFATGWLLSQFCLWCLTPAAVCAAMPITFGGVACTCSHGDGQVCPMHHPQAASTTPSCSCRSTTGGAASLVASVFGSAAVLGAPIAASQPAAISPLPAHVELRPFDSGLVPDAPPPRA